MRLRCTNPRPKSKRRLSSRPGLNAAYQNFFTAVEVNAALSLSLRVLVRARHTGARTEGGQMRHRERAPCVERTEYSRASVEAIGPHGASGRAGCHDTPHDDTRSSTDPDRELRLLDFSRIVLFENIRAN